MASLFILGTDTDIGKSVISAALLKGFLDLEPKKKCRYWKPVQAGMDHTDYDFIESLVPKVFIEESLYKYQNPTSPDQGIEVDSHPIDVSKLSAKTKKLMTSQDLVVVEGAGGLMVPLNLKGDTWLEYLESVSIPIVLVARSSLGTLNQTISTIELLKTIGVTPSCIILNGMQHLNNQKSLTRRYPKIPLYSFPFLEGDFSLNLRKGWKKECESLFHFMNNWMNKSDSGVKKEIPLLNNWDEDYCWHPYTQHSYEATPLFISRAKGVFYFDQNGNKLIDGIGSWWVNTIGHGRKKIAKAIKAQTELLDHSIFANATHEPGILLAKRITDKLSSKLNKVFYTDNGSCAVEVALKMAYQGFKNLGETNRTKFVSLLGGYHGDTFGTMAVGGSEGFHSSFKELLFPTIKLAPVSTHPSPYCPDSDKSIDENLQKLEEFFAKNHRSLCGVLLEPFIQGAGGMVFQNIKFLKKLCTLTKSYGIPLIFDEVFTGMGRLGTSFAFKKLGIEPDIICLAKGITGGALPLALTISTKDIFSRFLGEHKSSALLHGHSFTGNPIACSAALETLNIYDEEQLWTRGKKLELIFQKFIEEQSVKGVIENGRTIGSVLAFELRGSGNMNYFDIKSKNIVSKCFKNGLFIRPLGNTLYLTPPLSVTDDEIFSALNILQNSLGK